LVVQCAWLTHPLKSECCAVLLCTQDYIAGHWPRARGSFQELLMSRTAPDGSHLEDPPTKTLLTYMASHDYVAPESWAGVRELTEK
jgi:hypothetical protein